MEEVAQNYLAEQPIGRLMRKYAVPCIISLLVGALYNIVDQIFIANASYLGSYGNAANTVVFPLTVVALAIAVMAGDGCCAFVSMALGRNETEKARRSVGNAVVLSVVSSLVLTAVYLVFADSIIAMFGGTVNEFAEKAKEADGFIFGTPVHYAAASGNMTAFLDRLFYSAPKETFCRKPAAVVTSARRAGTTAAYEQLLKYPGIMEMPIVSSCYWNNVHGSCPEDVQKDEEGLRTMRVLGRNMAWLLRCIAAGTAAGVPAPRQEPMARTNFIR